MYCWQKCVKENISLTTIKMYLPGYLINFVKDLTDFKNFFITIIFKLSKILFYYINFL